MSAIASPSETPTPVRLDADGRLVPFSVNLTCTENNVEHDYDGGLVLLQIGHVPPAAQAPGILFNGFNVAMNFTDDGDRDTRTEMHAFPRTRAEGRMRWFRVTVEEVDDPRPPEDPVALGAPGPVAREEFERVTQALEAENAELRRRLEGAGNTPAGQPTTLAHEPAMPPDRPSTA